MIDPMLERPFRLEIGPYWILLPGHATVSAQVTDLIPGAERMMLTRWVVTSGRFQISIHLDATQGLDGLKSFIDYTTRSDVVTPSVTVNGVAGVTHGGYGAPRTWIDWWFKKGDVMICLCLQSAAFPLATPNATELAEHAAIINSLKYSRDFPSEAPPAAAE